MGSCARVSVPALHAAGGLHPAACQSAFPKSCYGLAPCMHTASLVIFMSRMLRQCSVQLRQIQALH